MERLFRSQVEFVCAVKVHNWSGFFILHLMHSITFKAEYMQTSIINPFSILAKAGKQGARISDRVHSTWNAGMPSGSLGEAPPSSYLPSLSLRYEVC